MIPTPPRYLFNIHNNFHLVAFLQKVKMIPSPHRKHIHLSPKHRPIFVDYMWGPKEREFNGQNSPLGDFWCEWEKNSLPLPHSRSGQWLCRECEICQRQVPVTPSILNLNARCPCITWPTDIPASVPGQPPLAQHPQVPADRSHDRPDSLQSFYRHQGLMLTPPDIWIFLYCLWSPL